MAVHMQHNCYCRGFNLMDPTRSPAAMWRVQQGLLSGKPWPKKGAAQKNRAKAIRDDVWQLWQRNAAKFAEDVAGISSGSSSSKTIRNMFSSTASAASPQLVENWGGLQESPR